MGAAPSKNGVLREYSAGRVDDRSVFCDDPKRDPERTG